jgi:hypothetical protein
VTLSPAAALAPELRSLLVSFPSLTVPAALEITCASAGELLVLARWGVASGLG